MADDETTQSDAGAEDARTLLTAALIGAAIGAGLGLLASRALDDDSVRGTIRQVRRRGGRAIRRRTAAVSELGSAAGEALGGARDTLGEYAERARDAFESALQREVKQLRRSARRQRRRLGL